MRDLPILSEVEPLAYDDWGSGMGDPADPDRSRGRTIVAGALVAAAVAVAVWVMTDVIDDGAVSQELPRQSSAATTTRVADDEAVPLPTVVEVPAGVSVPAIEPSEPSGRAGSETAPDGTLTAGGTSVFTTAPGDRTAYAGATVEGRDLVVTDVADDGFRVERRSDGDGVYVAFAEAGPVEVAVGYHVGFNGLVRVVPDDDSSGLRGEPIYVHALWIEVQAEEEGS